MLFSLKLLSNAFQLPISDLVIQDVNYTGTKMASPPAKLCTVCGKPAATHCEHYFEGLDIDGKLSRRSIAARSARTRTARSTDKLAKMRIAAHSSIADMSCYSKPSTSSVNSPSSMMSCMCNWMQQAGYTFTAHSSQPTKIAHSTPSPTAYPLMRIPGRLS